MTVAVHIKIEPTSEKTATLYEVNGNNKKRVRVKKFTNEDTEWTGHIWNGRDLVLQEEDLIEQTIVEE